MGNNGERDADLLEDALDDLTGNGKVSPDAPSASDLGPAFPESTAAEKTPNSPTATGRGAGAERAGLATTAQRDVVSLSPASPPAEVSGWEADAWGDPGRQEAGAWRPTTREHQAVPVTPKTGSYEAFVAAQSAGLASADPGATLPFLDQPARKPVDPAQRRILDDQGAVYLLCVRGEDEGHAFSLSVIPERDDVVGRGSSCTVVLADGSVSRDHARLTFENGHYLVEDLQSGNGTFINGERITRAHAVVGDELMFGRALFVLQDPAHRMAAAAAAATADQSDARGAAGKRGVLGAGTGVARPERAVSAWRTRWDDAMHDVFLRSAVIAIAMMGVAMVVDGIALWSYAAIKRNVLPADLAFDNYLQGVDAFRRMAWDEATQAFQVALELDSDHTRSKAYLAAIPEEKLAARQVEESRALLGRGDLAGAFRLVVAARDSMQRDAAEKVLADIRDQADSAIAKAQTAMQAGKVQEARAILAAVQVYRPDRADVMALAREMSALTDGTLVAAASAPVAPVLARDEPASDGSPRGIGTTGDVGGSAGGRATTGVGVKSGSGGDTRANVSPNPPAPSSAPAGMTAAQEPSSTGVAEALRSLPVGVGQQVRLYVASGELDKALALLRDPAVADKAQTARSQLTDLKEAYDRGMEEHLAKKAGTAIALLRRARSIAVQASPAKSALLLRIDGALADMYYVRGIQTYLKGDVTGAFQDFSQALVYQPNHGPSRSKLQDLAKKAQALLDEAERVESSDPARARRLWEQVLQLVPNSDPMNAIARARLSRKP